ncbi:MAG: hypothetical protein QM621_03330 [Aeromicrobium sp.]
MSEVFARLPSNDPPVLVAVHHPNRADGEVFTFLRVTPRPSNAFGEQDAGGTATIGMFVDAIQGRGSVNIAVSAWHAVDASKFSLASA